MCSALASAGRTIWQVWSRCWHPTTAATSTARSSPWTAASVRTSPMSRMWPMSSGMIWRSVLAGGKAGTATARAVPVPHFHVTSFDLGHGPVEPDPAVMQSGHVPVASYVDHERFEKEAALFGTVWLNIADESDVAKPGDWIVRP